jgi:hypothetical protein
MEFTRSKEMNIREPTIQQYVYFVRFIDTLEGMQERDSQIARQIESLRGFMEQLSGQAITGEMAFPSLSRNVSRQLFSTEGWLEKDGGEKAYSFTVRAHSDTTIVQIAYYRNSEGEQLDSPGLSEANVFCQIRHELWTGSAQKKLQDTSYFLAQTIVLCALTEQTEETMAQTILDTWVDAPNEPHQVSAGCDIGVGTLYFDTLEPTTWILLYSQQAEKSASESQRFNRKRL